MTKMMPSASPCVVIGDLVGSRAAPDRRAVHDALAGALEDTERAVPSLRGLAVSVGDEFQGVYATLGAALEVALRVRLLLLPAADVRVGVGRGEGGGLLRSKHGYR